MTAIEASNKAPIVRLGEALSRRRLESDLRDDR
jgi:hypothetical protein